MKNNKSILVKLLALIPPNMATGTPNTIQILKMLLPMILPTNISCSPFIDEIIVVTNSGKDVPNAIIVSDINLSLHPIILAILDALSTTKLLPITIPPKPIITKDIDLINPNLGSSTSF